MKLLWLLVAVAVWAPPGNQGQEYFECELSGDPHVIRFTGQRATIPFPCYYKAAGLKMITYPDTQAAQIGYSPGDIEASDLWEVEGNFPTYIVRTGYDGGLARVCLLWKNNPPLEVSFRPVNKSAQIPQTPRPGLFIKIKKGRPRTRPDNRFPHTICSQPWDTRTYKVFKTNTVQDQLHNNRQVMLWAALRQNHPQTHPKCVDVMNAFQECTWWNRKLAAVRECANYTERATVRCMESQGTEPGTALEAVTQCLTASCLTGAARDATNAWLQDKAC